MSSVFEKIKNDESFLKLRIFSICAIVSSFLFYYFMTNIDSSHLDWFPGRVAVAFISLAGFIFSYLKTTPFPMRRYFVNLISLGYIVMYLYLLQLNNWSVFHRWSYFVVIAIMATIVFSWKDYIYTALAGLILPVIAGFWSPLSLLELIHFHAANFVTFFVIGLTIRANFRYRDEVVNLTNSLVQNSKMIALGEMSSGLSHEINNPLTIITNGTAQIESYISEPEKNKSLIQIALERMTKASYRIAAITQGLHDFSQSDSYENFKKNDVLEIIAAAVDLCEEKFKVSGITLEQEISVSKAICFCQRLQLTQVLLNLLNNAYDACKNTPHPKIKITLKIQNRVIKVSVMDSGPGVPPEIEDMIMQPFFTTQTVGKGTGLGLSIALGIAQSNNGSLYLD